MRSVSFYTRPKHNQISQIKSYVPLSIYLCYINTYVCRYIWMESLNLRQFPIDSWMTSTNVERGATKFYAIESCQRIFKRAVPSIFRQSLSIYSAILKFCSKTSCSGEYIFWVNVFMYLLIKFERFLERKTSFRKGQQNNSKSSFFYASRLG